MAPIVKSIPIQLIETTTTLTTTASKLKVSDNSLLNLPR